MTHSHSNLLGEPPATLLPANPEADAELTAGNPPAEVAAHHPTVSAAWAALAEEALTRPERQLSDTIEAYAYARTGYHRGLDALRRNGWKGFGPVPWSHEPNRGFLRCVIALAKAAEAIEETDEHERCIQLLRDCDPSLGALRGQNGHWPSALAEFGVEGGQRRGQRGELLAAGHQPGEVGGVDVVPGEAAGHLTVRQQQEPVADEVGVARGVGHLQHGQALARAVTIDCSISVCCGTASGAVGSSMTSARAPKCRARAMARLCRSPARSVLAGCVRVQPGDADAGHRRDGRGLAGAVEVEPAQRAEPAGRLGAEEEVPPHRQQRGDGEVLPHGRDAGGAGLAGRPEAHRLAVDQQRALGVPGEPRQQRHQRRLARAVLARARR